MSLDRVACVEAFRAAVERCDPERLTERAKIDVVGPLAGRTAYGLALGKAALKMARGAGPVARGVIVTNADDGQGVPDGWHVMIGSHPEPDARSLAAGEAVIDLIAGATKGDLVLALISGGASSLVEWPEQGITLDELRGRVRDCMASGADIHAINALRRQLSALKGGKLARLSEAPVATMAISDVYDDDLTVIGSGPTIANRPGDRAAVIAPMKLFAQEFARAYNVDDVVAQPLRGSIENAADEIAHAWKRPPGPHALWGEPTVEIPEQHGEGGRAQQLALRLARMFREPAAADVRELVRTFGDAALVNCFVIGSDGIDGPAPQGRPTPAGAFVGGDTWDTIAAAGIDPGDALRRCDAGPALDAVNALVVTGPTGINHGDIMLVG